MKITAIYPNNICILGESFKLTKSDRFETSLTFLHNTMDELQTAYDTHHENALRGMNESDKVTWFITHIDKDQNLFTISACNTEGELIWRSKSLVDHRINIMFYGGLSILAVLVMGVLAWVNWF